MATRHKKGVRAKQQRQWVAVAQSTFDVCKRRGGRDDTCEGRAIRAANAVTGTPRMAHNIQTLTFTIQKAHVRYETVHDRDYLVADCIPIQEAVLNQWFIPAEEIGAYIHSWADLPLPITHPLNDYGEPVPVKKDPMSVAQTIGRLYNVSMDGRKLRGEMWIDIKRCEESGGDALECLRRIEAGEPLEMSTAFWAQDDPTPGTYNDVPYIGIRRHLIPDHLALLPHGVGACSNAMGCGYGVNSNASPCPSCQGACMPNKRDKGHLTAAIHAIRDMVLGVREDDLDADADALATHLTNSDIQKALQAALKREKEGERGQQDAYYDCYVIDIEDDQVIYSENGKTYRRPFTTDEENRVSFSGDAEEVQTDTRYLPVANAVKAGDSGHTHPPTQETNMDTNMQARVQHLIVHAHTAWTDQDAELLATFSEAQLVRLEAEAEARASQATAATDTHDAPDQEKEQDAEAGAAETVHPVTQHAHVAPANKASHASVALTLDAIRGVIHEEMDTRLATFETQIEARRERQQLVTQLTALGWTAEETRGMSHDALRKLASTLTPTNFVGMGLPALGTQAADDGPTDDPDWQ